MPNKPKSIVPKGRPIEWVRVCACWYVCLYATSRVLGRDRTGQAGPVHVHVIE